MASCPPTASSDAIAERLARLNERRGAPSGATGAAGPPPPGRPPRRQRRHPARTARVAAIGLSLVSTAGLSAYFVETAASAPRQVGSASIVSATAAASTTGATSPSPTSGATAPASTDPATTATPSTTAAARSNSVVDGATFQNKYGPVQVRVTFGPDGNVVSVDAVQTPDAARKSVEINSQAVPQLDAGAVSAQSAQVHTVSGATYTSNDYQRSVQSSIDAARAANLTTIA